MAAFRRFGAFYARSFERRPWVTLAIANGTLGAIADTLAQSLERYQKKGISPSVSSKESVVDSTTSIIKQETQQRDYMRTARFFAFGVMMAPLLDKWNRFIEFRLPLRAVGGSAAKVSMAALAKRVTVDQVGFAPFGLACFVGAMGFMEGRTVEGVQTKFKEMYIPAILANWQLWPLVQTINFRYMPLRYRVPFTGAVGIAWQVFLSILNSTKRVAVDEKEAIKA